MSSVSIPRRASAAPMNPVLGEIFASNEPYYCHWNDESDTVLLIFRGMPLTPTEWIPFQMVRGTIDLPCSKIYVRDFYRSWYQFGLPPYSHAVDDTAAFLLDLILQRGHVKRIVTTGVSSGGFAATMYGCLMQADEVHSFAGQSFIDIENRLKYNDFYMDEYLPDVYAGNTQKEYFDLRPTLMARSTEQATKYFAHYSTKQAHDVVNAEHIQGIPNVHLWKYIEGGHQIARHLKSLGKLDGLFDGMINGTTPQKSFDFDY